MMKTLMSTNRMTVMSKSEALLYLTERASLKKGEESLEENTPLGPFPDDIFSGDVPPTDAENPPPAQASSSAFHSKSANLTARLKAKEAYLRDEVKKAKNDKENAIAAHRAVLSSQKKLDRAIIKAAKKEDKAREAMKKLSAAKTNPERQKAHKALLNAKIAADKSHADAELQAFNTDKTKNLAADFVHTLDAETVMTPELHANVQVHAFKKQIRKNKAQELLSKAVDLVHPLPLPKSPYDLPQ